MTSRIGSARGILGDLKKSVELSYELDTEQEGSTFGTRWGETNLRSTGATRDGVGGRWKSQNRKNVYLSPYVEEPLNSKVIKGFVPELISRKGFSCFGIPMFYVYVIYTNIMNVLHTGMNMSISRIHIWLCYTEVPLHIQGLDKTMKTPRILESLFWNSYKTTKRLLFFCLPYLLSFFSSYFTKIVFFFLQISFEEISQN